MDPPSKRRRLSNDDTGSQKASDKAPTSLRSLDHPVSPPPRKKTRPNGLSIEQFGDSETKNSATSDMSSLTSSRVISSHFHLTWVQDLPEASNADAVTLRDILGDPLIAECWNFNYLHDLDFIMAAFDQDVRDLVQLHLVHGFWKKEDASRLMLQEQAKSYKNATLHCAFMPEMFGTHHCKMLILIRRDDTAQIIIHTANMIARDWTNMTQAVWKSPLLPLLIPEIKGHNEQSPTAGSGEKFKVDLLNYLKAYNRRRPVCMPLVDRLGKYNFSTIKAALVASVPGRHSVRDETEETKWGWAALSEVLKNVPVSEGKSELVVQISSIATLGPTDTWLRRTLFETLKRSKTKAGEEPKFKIVFPTPDEIRRSLDGYVSGASIHTKIQSAQQAKQLLYLRPMFCHWANDADKGQKLDAGAPLHESGRKRAAPHIKTYIRYAGNSSIDWAMITSANLSKQAWGEAVNSAGEVRIASWEIGVLVWPSLFGDKAKMVGTFQTDTPDSRSTGQGQEAAVNEANDLVVGIRVPYNLPLQAYGPEEKPWVATASYSEPDWKGHAWTAR